MTIQNTGSKLRVYPYIDELALPRARREAAVVQEELEFQYDPNMNMDPGINAEIPASSGGIEVWNELFQIKQVKLPETNFMMRLKTLLSAEQITQVGTSIRELQTGIVKINND